MAVKRRTGLLVAAGLAVLVAGYWSDAVLLEWPDRLSTKVERGLRRRYRHDGLVALWTFDGPAIRDAVSGARALDVGPVLVAGRAGLARMFDGRDDYIATPMPWSRLGGRYAISVGMRINRTPSSSQSILFTEVERPSGLQIVEGQMTLTVPSTRPQVAAYPFAAYGRWVTVTGVVDVTAGTAWLYEDGILRATTAVSEVIQPPELIEVGKARRYQVRYPLDGAIDGIAIWGRPLGPDEVRELAGARGLERAVTGWVAGGYALARVGTGALRSVTRTAARVVDYFNPVYHESAIYGSDLPVVSLRLSRKDLGAFQQAREETVRRGALSPETRRRVDLMVGVTVHDARMTLYGKEPALWTHPKMAFVLEGEALQASLGAGRVLFLPPETRGLLRALVHGQVAERFGLPHRRNGLGVVRINGAFRGLYYWEEHLVDGEPPDYADPEFPRAVAALPVPGEALLDAYDALRQRFEPLLVRDRRITWPSREVRYRIGRDRAALARVVEDARTRPPAAAVALVARHLTARGVLDGNPAPSYVIDDLRLPAPAFPGVSVTWTSSRPDLVNERGRVTRPSRGAPAQVALTASVTGAGATAETTLDLTVMPAELPVPALRLRVPAEIENTYRTPAGAELIEAGGARRTGWLAGAIRLRGNSSLYRPKKSYSVRFDWPPGFFEGSDARIIHLMASWADSTFVRDRLAYDLFRSFGRDGAPRPSPRVRFVEVFLNDEYQGLYELAERVDRFLLGFPRAPAPDGRRSVIYRSQQAEADLSGFAPQSWVQIEPPPEEGDHWGPLAELTAFVGTADPERFGREIERRIDVPAFIDFLILVNLFAHQEGIRFNLFVARGNRPGDRFMILPWDYDKSMRGLHDQWLSNARFARLASDPGFRDRLKVRWRELRRDLLAESSLLTRIGTIEAEFADAVDREFALWPRPWGTYAQEAARLREWLRLRLPALDAILARP